MELFFSFCSVAISSRKAILPLYVAQNGRAGFEDARRPLTVKRRPLYLLPLQVDYGNEFFMVNRAFKAIRRADVVLLMVDVEAGITDQVNARHVVFCKLFISDRQLRVSPPHQSAVLVSHHNTLWISFAAAIGAPCAHSDLFPWTEVGAARQL